MFYHAKLVVPLALFVTILLTWMIGLRGPQVVLALVAAYAVVDLVALPAIFRFTGWAIRRLGGDSAS